MLQYMLIPALLMLPVGIYLFFPVRRCVTLLDGGRRAHTFWVSAIATSSVMLPALNIWGLPAVAVLHFAALSALTSLIFQILRRFQTGRIWRIVYQSSLIPLGITALILLLGYCNMKNVVETDYSLSSAKVSSTYHVIFLSDLHFGTTMDEPELRKYCAELSARSPDVVILGGDIVDENTSLTEMRDAFSDLGNITSTLGVYYVFGNHDKARYSSEPPFTEDELRDAISSSGIHILEDSTMVLTPDLTITGRQDRSDSAMAGIQRASSDSLLDGVDPDAYHILVDHEPVELSQNGNYDLMLSGHTHGGQIWPVGLLMERMGHDTMNYGMKRLGGETVLVSSGIGGWGYPVRTGHHSEYLYVTIAPTANP